MPAQADSGLRISLRVALALWGLVLLVLMSGFIMQSSWAIVLWPWPDSRLTYVFIASVLAAIAIPCLWISISGEVAAMRAGALSLTLTHAGITVLLLLLLRNTGDTGLLLYITVAAVSVLLSLLIFLLCRGIAVRDEQPVPALVQIFFFIFVLLLIIAGSALVVQIPNVFPWPLKAESSLLLGWIFYGIAVYFVYALLFSQWGYDTGPLLGLTANALVMLGPLIMQLKTAADAQLPGLIAYLVILIAGLLLACYFLFIHRSTRFWGRRVLRKAISE